MWRALGLSIVVACLGVMGCSGDDDGCFSDDECGYGLVCNRAEGECVSPPGDCHGLCQTLSTCGVEDEDDCIKESCGASFLEYYGDTYGDDCEQAWLDLMECQSHLSCEEYTQFAEEADASAGTAPFCEAELQTKNDEC